MKRVSESVLFVLLLLKYLLIHKALFHQTALGVNRRINKEKVMLVISLFVCIQQSGERFQTRRKLARLTIQQLNDIGMTKERQHEEISRATIKGLWRDVVLLMKQKGRTL